ncbi:hypothetical protein ACS0TY_015474 [Phlomoides rotata]
MGNLAITAISAKEDRPSTTSMLDGEMEVDRGEMSSRLGPWLPLCRPLDRRRGGARMDNHLTQLVLVLFLAGARSWGRGANVTGYRPPGATSDHEVDEYR